VSAELTPTELVETGRALADTLSWSGSAWRRLFSPVPELTRDSVLADLDEIAKRLEEVRMLLGSAELPSVPERPSGTGWV
jgi:hypothetical protein